MPYPYPLRLQGLLGKEESQYAVDAAPTPGADGIRVVGMIWPALSGEYVFPNLREEVNTNSLVGAQPGAPHGRIYNLDFETPLAGAGVAYSSVTPVRPEVDPLIMACGMSRTHDDTGSAEKVTYALADTGHSSATVWAYAGGKLFKLVGCRGLWTWNPLAGQLGRMRFRLQGLMLVDEAEASVPSITYDSVIEPAARSMGLAVVPNGSASWTPAAAQMEVTPGHEADRFDDVNAADGVEGFFIGQTVPTFGFTPRTEDLTDYDIYAHRKTDPPTDHTIDMTLGSSQYNRVKLDVNEAYLRGYPQGGEDGRFAAWDSVEYFCRDMALIFD